MTRVWVGQVNMINELSGSGNRELPDKIMNLSRYIHFYYSVVALTPVFFVVSLALNLGVSQKSCAPQHALTATRNIPILWFVSLRRGPTRTVGLLSLGNGGKNVLRNTGWPLLP